MPGEAANSRFILESAEGQVIAHVVRVGGLAVFGVSDVCNPYVDDSGGEGSPSKNRVKDVQAVVGMLLEAQMPDAS